MEKYLLFAGLSWRIYLLWFLEKASGLWAVFHQYGIKLVPCYHALGILGERTTLIWNKIQNLVTISGLALVVRPWSFRPMFGRYDLDRWVVSA